MEIMFTERNMRNICGFNVFLIFFGPNWLVTAPNRFLSVIFGPVRLFWVRERSLTGLGLG